MKRAEAEVVRKLDPDPEHSRFAEPDIQIGDFLVQRRCPHRNADLAAFGEIDGEELVCTLHGWRFDVATGRCLTAADQPIRIRPFDPAAPTEPSRPNA
jgi:UDP-MurNAc hydroxylase